MSSVSHSQLQNCKTQKPPSSILGQTSTILKSNLNIVNTHYRSLFFSPMYCASLLWHSLTTSNKKHRASVAFRYSYREKPVKKMILLHCPSNDLNPDWGANSIPRTLSQTLSVCPPIPAFLVFIVIHNMEQLLGSELRQAKFTSIRV